MTKKQNYDYTAAERKKRERERDKENGIVHRDVKVHIDDWPDVKKYAEKKLKKRLRDLTP